MDMSMYGSPPLDRSCLIALIWSAEGSTSADGTSPNFVLYFENISAISSCPMWVISASSVGSTLLLSFSFLVGDDCPCPPPAGGRGDAPTMDCGGPGLPKPSGGTFSLRKMTLRKISTREASTGVKSVAVPSALFGYLELGHHTIPNWT